jgi:hypothetical protein
MVARNDLCDPSQIVQVKEFGFWNADGYHCLALTERVGNPYGSNNHTCEPRVVFETFVVYVLDWKEFVKQAFHRKSVRYGVPSIMP